MAKKQTAWQTISLTPMTGQLDARYRPTEIPDGGFKEKQNLSVSENGKLGRKSGFERLFAASLFWGDPYDSKAASPCGASAILKNGKYWCPKYTNWDFHQRNVAVRKPITGTFEITKSDETRYLLASTESEISLLNETTGQWSDIYAGNIVGGKFRCGTLQDTVIFIDRQNIILAYDLSGAPPATIPELDALGVTSAKVVIQYNGLMLLMNTTEWKSSGDHTPTPFSSRIRYCDLNAPRKWTPGATGSVAGMQDLDYGEHILAAALLQGNIIIYTNRGMWLCSISIDPVAGTALSFGKIYTEPKNNAGCIVYPDSLVSTGDAHYFGSRESFYTYNPYLPTPEAPEWLRQATGLIYTDKNRKIDPNCCLSMCAEYRPLTHEMWVSWPSAGNGCENNQSMILSTKFLTGYYLDAGFSAMTNYKPNPPAEADCNVAQIMVVASTADYALKQAGLVLFREFVRQPPSTKNPAPTVADNITNPIWSKAGFTSILRGIVPVTLFDVQKLIRKVILGAYTAPQANPCIARLRLGTSEVLADPNNTTYCEIVWHDIRPDLVLACPEKLTAEQMKEANLIPSFSQEWNIMERGKYLYFEISILNADGTPAIGGDVHAHKIDFEILPLPA